MLWRAAALILATAAMPQVQELRRGPTCRTPTKVGDRVTFNIAAYSPDIEKAFSGKLPPLSDRGVKVTVDIGDYGVPMVNDGLLGMCIGDARKLTVPLGPINIYYLVNLLDVRSSSRDEL